MAFFSVSTSAFLAQKSSAVFSVAVRTGPAVQLSIGEVVERSGVKKGRP